VSNEQKKAQLLRDTNRDSDDEMWYRVQMARAVDIRHNPRDFLCYAKGSAGSETSVRYSARCAPHF
jgi:hypothetical protein